MQKSLFIRVALTSMLALSVGAIGCDGSDGPGGSGGDGGMGGGGSGGDGGMGGGGSGGDGGVGGGVTPGVVTATPASSTFISSLDVELSIDGPEGDGATIYYTTDLTSVLDEEGNVQGTEYTDPISLNETTVLKFLAQLADDTFSGEQSEGYTRTNGDSKREEWANSGHGHLTGEAWRHWDGDGEVPSRCAKCHSAESVAGVGNSLGFLEFATTGGNALPAPLPLGLECVACHERFPTIYSDLETYWAIEPVTFPSTAELSLHEASNICMSCHQGRESGLDVQDTIDDDDGVGPYRFINIHYYPAAATMFGSEADGGYQYPGMGYTPRNTFPSHPGDYANCVGCHMRNAEDGEAHTWVPGVDTCTGCHDEGDTFETLKGSPSQAYDNITALLPELYGEIQRYAADVIGVPIEYRSGYPYFFEADTGEGYTSFDATLLPAAYNYQAGLKDPAGYIHNGTYTQQILYDSIAALGASPSVEVIGRGDLAINGVDVGTASKSDQWHISGHGALGDEAFRHWDAEGEIPASCVKCHSTPGFADYAEGVAESSQLPTTGIDCWACHNSRNLFANTETRWDVSSDGDPLEPILFPSGAELTLNNDGNMCMACHQGRASGSDVDDATSNDQNAYPSFDFINIHYYAAAAVLFGSEAAGGYEYDNGLVYRGRNTFVGLHDTMGRQLTDCVGCHMNSNPDTPAKHTFLPQEVGDCSLCHSGGPSFRDLNTAPRSNFFAIGSLRDQLLAAIQAYATTGNPGTGLPKDSPVQYDGHSYPYWFQGGVPPIFPNRYRDFDRTMLKAAYNFVVSDKDPAGYIHNGTYVQQLLWDSIVDLGACPNLNPPPAGRETPPPTCP